jgi:hypothetical protein
MTQQEKVLVQACGTLCHATVLENRDSIEAMGLDPDTDQSLVLRGPKRPKAVYLCPENLLDKALEFLGDRAKDQEQLDVFRIDAVIVAEKNCGADYGWLAAHLPGDQLNAVTIAISLEVGGLACYHLIPPEDFISVEEVPKPKFGSQEQAFLEL